MSRWKVNESNKCWNENDHCSHCLATTLFIRVKETHIAKGNGTLLRKLPNIKSDTFRCHCYKYVAWELHAFFKKRKNERSVSFMLDQTIGRKTDNFLKNSGLTKHYITQHWTIFNALNFTRYRFPFSTSAIQYLLFNNRARCLSCVPVPLSLSVLCVLCETSFKLDEYIQ